MGLSIDGFPPTQEVVGRNGDHALITRKALRRGDAPITDFVATLTGLPVPGPGRWIASAIAAAIAALGFVFASGKLRTLPDGRSDGDRDRARELLLDELVELELARKQGGIGPRAYEQARAALVGGITRLGLPGAKKSSDRRNRKRQGSRTNA
jgi:hypothetical protein